MGKDTAVKNMSPVGRISKTYGVDGELVLNLYNGFPSEINYEEPLFVFIDGLAVPLFIESFARKGQRGAVVRFSDIDTPYRAEQMSGLELLARSDDHATDAGSDDEFYFDDLVGFELIAGDARGEITGFIDSEMNPLFEVVIDGGEFLIPAAEEFIDEIDVDSATITMSLPDGLLDLNDPQ